MAKELEDVLEEDEEDTPYDIGIQLSNKLGEIPDMKELIDAINEAIERFGFRAQRYAKWTDFRQGCVMEDRFIQDLQSRLAKKD